MTVTALIPGPRTEPNPADRWEIVTRAQQGDVDAFGLLYELYQPKVQAFIWRRTSDRHLADDLTHDVFVRALRSIGGLSWQGRDPGAWLITVARNIVLDYFKSGRVRYESMFGGGEAIADRGIDEDRRADPEQVAVFNSVSPVIDAALAKLSPDQRQVLALRYGAGLSVAETAAAMGKNEGAIKAAAHRATRAMAGLLREAGVGSC